VRRKSGTNHFYKMLRERAYELGRIPDVNDVKLLALCANGGLTQGRRGMADAVAYLKKWARKACRAAGGAGAAPQQPAPQPPSPPVAEHGLRQRSAAFLAKLGLINPAMAAQCAAVEVVVVAVTARPGALKQVVCAGGIAGATNFVVRTAEEEDWSD
jgi:hypothetical protein